MATVTNLSKTWKICSRLLEKKLFQRNGRRWTLIELTLRQRHGWNLHPRQNTVYPQRSKGCTFTNLTQFLNITLRNKKHRGTPEICYTDMLYVEWLRYIYMHRHRSVNRHYLFAWVAFTLFPQRNVHGGTRHCKSESKSKKLIFRKQISSIWEECQKKRSCVGSIFKTWGRPI